jgi:signal transduction histidine kinase
LKNTSLTSRITTLSFLGISIAIVIAGSFIIWSFNKSIEKSLSDNIAAYMDIFIASTSIDEKGAIIINSDTDFLDSIPRYWQISSGGKFIQKSAQLKDWAATSQQDNALFAFNDNDGTKIIAMQKTVVFPKGVAVTYLFGVQSEIAEALKSEQKAGFIEVLIASLIVLTIILVLFTYLQVQITIRPLNNIKNALANIKNGQQTRLEGSFPKEIQPLAHEINNLLDYGMQVVERHRTFAANLSHSLKTPLSVLNNDAQKNKGALAEKVKETTLDMLSIIDRNLARAKVAGSSNILGARTEILPVINKISGGFAKLYGRKAQIDCAALVFKGDEGDLFELLGNIIENACKYAKSEVRISASGGENLVITIEDDGKGIPKKDRQKVLERGVRLDESIAGTGIGLPIALDIAQLYNGTIALEDSELGGLAVIVSLPL